MNFPEFETLKIDMDKRGVATLILNRPDKHNALNEVLIADLRSAAALLDRSEDVRVVVLTGAGKSFCAGGDIQWFAGNMEKNREGRIWETTELAKMLRELNDLSKPLIGKINGPAYGGGVGMISVCDIAIGHRSSKFGLTEVRLGLIPATISPYVVDRIGTANARATMLSGALFSAEKADQIGLLNEVVDLDELDKRIEEIVLDHLEAAPGAVAATKRLISFVSSHQIEDNMLYTADRLADAWETDEGETGVHCFLNKQKPHWRSN
jgi:methylglutaconyl-CoA hydratase